MRISFEQIAKELQKKFSVEAYNGGPDFIITEFYPFPRTLDLSGFIFRQDTIYVCEYVQLRKFDPDMLMGPLLCVCDPDEELDGAFFRKRPTVIVRSRDMQLVLLTLPEILYKKGTVSSALTDVSQQLLSCSSPEELLETGFLILQNPLIVTDNAQRIILFTDPNLVKGSIYREVIDLQVIPTGHPDTKSYENKRFSLSTNDYDLMHNTAVIRDEGCGNLPTVLFTSLSVGHQTVGFLHLLAYQRPITADDEASFELLGRLMSAHIYRHPEQYSREPERQAERLVRVLLDERTLSAEHIRRQLALSKLKLGQYLYASCFTFKRRDLIPRLSCDDLAKSISSLLGSAVAIVYKNSIFMLLYSDKRIDSFKQRLSPISLLMERYELIVGISNEFSDIADMRKNTFMARKALYYGSTLYPGERIFLYRDFSVYYMIEQCTHQNGADVFCAPELLELVDYSKKNGGDLVNTLDVYLKCGRSKSKTAEALFVHLNTVKYRMSQIENIMGIDLENNDNAIRLGISLKIMEYLEHFRGYEQLPDLD